MNYYNEIDDKAAAWLRELISEKLIPYGEVDERDIRDVRPVELIGYTQCHFFAGIGGWPLALKVTGWPDDRPVWTGSCPCQPFSQAGRREGLADERHLWPSWFWLIEQCGPTIVFGEQVASKAALEQWFDGLVAPDMEGLGYAIDAEDLPAAGVGAPHIRQRLFWVAAISPRLEVVGEQYARQERDAVKRGGTPGRLADAESRSRTNGVGEHGSSKQHVWPIPRASGRDGVRDHSARDGEMPPGNMETAGFYGGLDRPRSDNGFWRDADWLGCRDSRWRPVEPGTFPLAHGVPARVAQLRGYGNAIVPQVAAQFVGAWLHR